MPTEAASRRRRRRRPAVADGRPARRRDLRLAGARRARARRPARARPARRARRRRSREQLALVAGRRRPRRAGRGAGAAAPHPARPAGARADARRHRAAATGSASSTSRSRWPGATAPAQPTYAWPRWRRCCARTSPADDPLRAYADRLEQPPLGGQSLRGYLSGSIDVVLRVPRATAAVRGRRLQDQPARRPRAAGSPRPTTARDQLAAAMLHSDYPLQALLYSVVAAPLPALAAARLRPGDPPRRRRSTSTCAACAVPRPRWSTATRPGCSAGGRRRRWCSRCPTCSDGRCRMTATVDRGFDRRPRAGAPPGCCATFNQAGVLRRRRRARGAPAGRPARRDRRAGRCSPPRSPCARCAAGSVCVDLADGRATRSGEDGAELPWPDARRPGWRRWPRSPLVGGAAPCCGSSDDRALPRPLLARGGAGLRTTCVGRPAAPAPPVADEAALPGRARPALPRRGVRRAARRRRDRRSRSGPPCSPAGPGTGKTTTVAGAAGAARRAGASAPASRRLRIALTAPTGKAAARLQEAVDDEMAQRLPAADRDRLGDLRAVDPAPAARLAPRLGGPLPARPRQPAAPRRGRRRRDLDGVADDDGPAARGGAPRDPAGPGRRPRPARLGRGRCGAGRPGRRARSSRRPRRGRRAAHLPPVRRARSASSRSAVRDGPTPTTPSRCCAAVATGSSSSSRRRPARRPAVRCCCPTPLAIRRGRRGRRRDRRAGGARPAPAALRAPRGPLRRRPLEPHGRALDRRGDRGPALGRRGTPAGRCW